MVDELPEAGYRAELRMIACKPVSSHILPKNELRGHGFGVGPGAHASSRAICGVPPEKTLFGEPPNTTRADAYAPLTLRRLPV